MNRHRLYLACALLPLYLGGCITNPEIVKIAPDTYMLARQSVGGMFGNSAALKAEVINEANAFAEDQGKIAIPVAFNEIPGGEGRYPAFEYQFRVVDPGPASAQTAGRVDTLYEELTKLDELRRKGLLTTEEFEREKQKLLQAD